MSRTPEQIIDAMAAAARLVPFDDATTWYDRLFEAVPDGDRLSMPDEPDRALLAALAAEYAALDTHAATLPDRAHVAWLEDILRIPRLPVVPDRVVAHVTVDPKLAPAVVAKDTLLRGGKDAFRNERRYRTLDALTAHGAALVGVRSMAPGGTTPGLPGVAGSAPAFPLSPTDGPDATHVLRIHSPALTFEGGDLTAALAFGGATGVAGLSSVVWRYSHADGTISDTIGGSVSGSTVTVPLTGGCGAADGGTPWLECVVPPHVPVPESLAFTSVTVAVTNRTPFVPQAAFHNDGAVDVTKEFQPFGAVAKRGDAFYVRADEAFGKSLSTLDIGVTIMQAGGAVVSASTGGSGIPGHVIETMNYEVESARDRLGGIAGAFDDFLDGILDLFEDPGEPTVRWQRRLDGGWVPFGDASDRFGSVSSDAVSGAVGSEPFAVAGQDGHYVRAFLSQGDFGWTAYQAMVARFATQAVAGGTPTMEPPPTPPIASAITVSYTTAPVDATLVESTSGWRRATKVGTGPFIPFRRAVSDAGEPGMVAVGFELPDSALGSTVSLYFDVDSASPCGAADAVSARWQWWDGSAWTDLAVADGSRQLRESGLLRFVAPLAWPTACRDVGAGSGRWIRLVTSAADRLGVVRDVVLDAVLAEFVSGAADPASDPSSATALPPGTIKGTLSPIRGVKKVTNLASVRGRAPEADESYLVRASARPRHRDRALTPWDYEQHVALTFPEVAAVLCLPHTNRDGAREPGKVGIVLVPDRPLDPSPRPSVSLTERVVDALAPSRPTGAEVVVLCPQYEPVSVVATVRLRRGIAALTGKEAITAALEAVLHPTGTRPTRWGRSLYASTLISFLERQESVDVVTLFDLRDAAGTSVELVEVDACRGLYCSSGSHALTCEEQL